MSEPTEFARLLAEQVLHMDMVTPRGIRARALARQVLDTTEESPAELALRSLACWLGAGGYHAPTVDAKVFEEKIRWGVANYEGEVTRLRGALRGLLDACDAADVAGNLAGEVDGSLMDAARAALAP
jgi:hypothetical protein